MMGYWQDEDGNPVTPEEESYSGVLVLEEGTMPYLNSSSVKVFLGVPPYALDQIDLKGGETISVTGFEMPGAARWDMDETGDSVFLHVVSAEIDGETFTLEQPYGRAGAYGGASGCGFGRGRAPRGGRARW